MAKKSSNRAIFDILAASRQMSSEPRENIFRNPHRDDTIYTMSLEDREIIHEFLIESGENLARLDQEMVELERRPKDAKLLASIFRTIHTIKGTCGFLGFTTLESVTHIGESILSQVRDYERDPAPELVSLILEMVDMVKQVLTTIEATGGEGEDRYLDLRQRLQSVCDQTAGSPPLPAPPALVVSAAASPELVQGATRKEKQPTPAALEIAISADAGNAAAQKGSPVADSTIRVDVVLLDKLMNLVGELVLACNRILQFNPQINSKQEDAAFNAASQRLNLIVAELRESVMKARMQPIGVVWNKLPRVVRDLAASCGKQIQLEMDGAETELDKTIIEAIKDPLTHIVRNCCDHGIEPPGERLRQGKPAQGRLLLRAFHENGYVNIEIADDGAGIDPQRIRDKALQKNLIRPEHADRMAEREILDLVFQPGFSTAEQVSAVSGRGVGMDVVKTNIEKIGGIVDLASRVGHGTTVKIRIPITPAIIPGLVVFCGERALTPQMSLLGLARLEDQGKAETDPEPARHAGVSPPPENDSAVLI
jgi:two-component system chemotaxis sensor kinase CheA